MKILTHSGSSLRETCSSGQKVHNFMAFLSLPLIFSYLCSQIGAVLSCLTASHADEHAKNQSKTSKYIAFDKGDLQLQATNLAEGQNAQPMLLGDSPDQSILQDSKCYFVAQFSHIFISCRLRGVWTNMLVNTANIEGAERDWYVLK